MFYWDVACTLAHETGDALPHLPGELHIWALGTGFSLFWSSSISCHLSFTCRKEGEQRPNTGTPWSGCATCVMSCLLGAWIRLHTVYKCWMASWLRVCFLVINSLSYNFHKIKCIDLKFRDQCVLTNICLYLSITLIKTQKFSIIWFFFYVHWVYFSLLLNPRQLLTWYFSLNFSSACSKLNINWKHTVYILLCLKLLLLNQIIFVML